MPQKNKDIYFEKDFGKQCKTKYPIVFSFAFWGSIKHSFGRIPKVLREDGADVYMANKHSLQSHMYRAKELKKDILEILAITGKPKVNIIGHCQGALDARYMIANLGMADKVASWTGITSGHQGVVTFDFLDKIMPLKYMHKLEKLVDDKEPNFLESCLCIGTKFMKEIFNPYTPNKPNVYYQTWTIELKDFSLRQIEHYPMWLLTKILEGNNDAYVATNTGKWGNYRGLANKNAKDVSHYDIVDYQEDSIKIKGFDVLDFYISLVKELKEKGF